MGEVRKRKVSGDAKTAAAKPVVTSDGGGLGLIPVVLIAAVLAGSGCYVIKKDHAASFADIENLTVKLKSDNAQILKTVEAMKKNIDQKDGIIKELQQKVTAGNEKNRLMEEKMGDLNELLQSTEEKLRTDIDAKYDDNMTKIKKYAAEIGDYSNRILQSNNRLDKTNEKLDDIITQVADGADAAGARQSQIDNLEKALEETKEASVAKTEELKQLVQEQTADSGALDVQAAQLTEVNGQIEELNAKIQEGAQSIAKLNAETVAINVKIENVETISKQSSDAIDEIKSTGGAQLDLLNEAIPILQAKIEQLSETVDEVASAIPSETLLVTLQTAAQKATDGLSAALKDIAENSHEIRAIKATSEKELAELTSRLASAAGEIKEGASVSASVQESIDSANKIISALTKDIDGLKKRAQKK